MLERAAKGCWVLGILTGAFGIILLEVRRGGTETDLLIVSQDQRRWDSELRDIESQFPRKAARAEALAKQVSESLAQRDKLKVEMAQVLARARALEDARDQFEDKRADLEKQLNRIDGYYLKVREVLPGATPK
jgi:septal ring factor EnvC (AmiA/AmiB activator)